jgi:hypothetical protein
MGLPDLAVHLSDGQLRATRPGHFTPVPTISEGVEMANLSCSQRVSSSTREAA